MRMAHTCVRVKDIKESVAFYEDAFGFKIKSERDFPEHEFSLTYLTLDGDDYELELTYNYNHGPYDIGDGYGHIAIASDDLEGLHAKQVAAGYNVTDLKSLPGQDPHYYFITDPDGYKVEVIRQK